MIRAFRCWSALLAGLASVAGCAEERPTNRYESVNGVIGEISAETGEIGISLASAEPRRTETRLVRCLCTKDTEIYVNDRFSAFESLRAGDNVRLVGYREASSESRRIVASYVRVERPRPPAEPPASLKAATAEKQGATQP